MTDTRVSVAQVCCADVTEESLIDDLRKDFNDKQLIFVQCDSTKDEDVKSKKTISHRLYSSHLALDPANIAPHMLRKDFNDKQLIFV